jgi:hypothetical protein
MDWHNFLFILKPACQALLFVILTPVCIFIIKPKTADKAWTVATYLFAAYLIANAILIWFDENYWRYFFYSLGFFICYITLIATTMPALLRILRLRSSQESAMAFLIVIYQPFVLLFMLFVKWLVVS